MWIRVAEQSSSALSLRSTVDSHSRHAEAVGADGCVGEDNGGDFESDSEGREGRCDYGGEEQGRAEEAIGSMLSQGGRGPGFWDMGLGS